uniref:RRM domain-containing protein n=1 Tax=Romanomermis culicivorax TaxID=13658 RepID=A0A915JKR7_ROMCU
MREEGKLFIGGLSASTDDEMLKEYYSQWGRLIDFIVMKDPVTKRSRGFGFVTYADPSCADLAMSCRPHSIDGKAVEAKRATPRESDNNSKPNVVNKPEKVNPVKRIFLSGIKDEHDETMFTEYFSQFGVVSSVEIVMDKNTGKKRGFGYVTFDTSDAVESAVAMKSHMIGGMRCDAKKALSRDEMNRSSYQYGRDRQQRDYRSRGTGRGETHGFGNGYGGGYGSEYGSGYGGRYNSGGYGGNYGQMSGNGAWSGGGYQQKGAAPYYSPDPYARNQNGSANGSLSAPYQTPYGGNGASSGYQQPQSWNADQSQLNPSQGKGSWNAVPRQADNSWGQPSYPGQQPAAQNWSHNSNLPPDGASGTWQNGPSAAGMYIA